MIRHLFLPSMDVFDYRAYLFPERTMLCSQCTGLVLRLHGLKVLPCWTFTVWPWWYSVLYRGSYAMLIPLASKFLPAHPHLHISVSKVERSQEQILHSYRKVGWGGGCTLLGSSTPPQLLSLLLLKGRAGKNMMEKGSRAEIRPGRSLTSYHHGQNRLNMGRLI